MGTKGSGAASIERRGGGSMWWYIYNMQATVGWKSLGTTVNIKGNTLIITGHEVSGPTKVERTCDTKCNTSKRLHVNWRNVNNLCAILFTLQYCCLLVSLLVSMKLF